MTWHPDMPDEFKNQIVTGDARELAERIPDESVDLFIEDPPYGIRYASSRKTRNGGGPRKYEASFGPDILDTTWLSEVARCLKVGGALYLFTRWDVLHVWKAAIEDTGLQVTQRIVWNKSHWKMGDLRYYGSQTEDILFCRKGEHQLRWPKRGGNLWSSSSSAYLPEGQYDHPTQKPEMIISRMIEYSSLPNDLVIDLHCGSGTIPACAYRLGRQYFACDIREKYVLMARERVLNTQPPLFVLEPEQMEMPLRPYSYNELSKPDA